MGEDKGKILCFPRLMFHLEWTRRLKRFPSTLSLLHQCLYSHIGEIYHPRVISIEASYDSGMGKAILSLLYVS